MIESVANEMKKSPVATFTSVVGLVIAACSLYLSYSGYEFNLPEYGLGSVSDGGNIGIISVANILLVIAFYIPSSIFVATLTRLLAKKHALLAVFLSVLLAVLLNFFAILIIYLSPPRHLSRELFSSAHEVLFYSTVIVFIAVCGAAVLRVITVTSTGDVDDERNAISNVYGTIIIVMLVLSVWASIVYKGQVLMTTTFLPDITHPVL